MNDHHLISPKFNQEHVKTVSKWLDCVYAKGERFDWSALETKIREVCPEGHITRGDAYLLVDTWAFSRVGPLLVSESLYQYTSRVIDRTEGELRLCMAEVLRLAKEIHSGKISDDTREFCKLLIEAQPS